MIAALEAISVAAALLDLSENVLGVTSTLKQSPGWFRVNSPGQKFQELQKQAVYKRAINDLRTERSTDVTFVCQPAGSATPVPVSLRRLVSNVETRNLVLFSIGGCSEMRVPAPKLLKAMYDLTPAEAKVMWGICHGSTPAELAVRLNISRETVRSQLKSVLMKTGTGRQSQLVLLIARNQLVFGDDELLNTDTIDTERVHLKTLK